MAILLQEPFDYPDGPAPSWEPVGGTWGVVSGEYSQSALGGGMLYSVAGNPAWADYSIQSDMRFIEYQPTGCMGIVFRYVNRDNFYYVYLRADNALFIGAFEAKAVRTIDSKYFPVDVTKTYTMKVEVEGAAIRVYIDNILELEVTDPVFAAGRIGLITYGSYTHFDNVLAETIGIEHLVTIDSTPITGVAVTVNGSLVGNTPVSVSVGDGSTPSVGVPPEVTV